MQIRFAEGVNFQTNLHDLIAFINNYFKPPQTKKRKTREPSGEINVQCFFRGGGHQEWYGYANLNQLNYNSNDLLLANAKDKFVQSICNSQSYVNQVSCW